MIKLFKNKRKKSYDLLAYEALLRMLKDPYWQSDRIIGGYKREKAGYDGERAVDYTLATLGRKDWSILRGLRLENPPFHFQIDNVILTKKFICIPETKNYKGIFRYDSKLGQLTQEVNGKIKSYKDPIMQAEAQKNHFNSWLAHRGIFNIPIETLVVVAYPSTIIENVHRDPVAYEKIIHAASLPQRLSQMEERYQQEVLSASSLRNLSKQLLQADVPLRSDVVESLGFTEKHFVIGVPCPKCNRYPMKRLYKNWLCENCKHTDPRAHKQVIFDHFLINGDTITKGQCREILQTDLQRTPRSLLDGMNLHKSGNRRTGKYHAPHISLFPQQSTIPAYRQDTLRSLSKIYSD